MFDETILIVDDQEDNIAVLYTFLEEKSDYNLLVATDGESALRIIKERKPDLVLLDIMMPGLSGLEVCRQVKGDPDTKEVPVIFMTALSDTSSKVEGFGAGAVDYITKPFRQEEVLARVRTHLSLSELRHSLIQRNEELKSFSSTVAHDLKNPLNSISLSTALALDECEDGNYREAKEELGQIQYAIEKASSIIDALLLLADSSRNSVLVIRPFDMGKVLSVVKERLDREISQYNGTLKLPDRWPTIRGYEPWVEEIWVNYILNALKYGGTPPRVELGFDEGDDEVRFWVRDNGVGLSEEQMTHLFIPFRRLHKERSGGHGLGLSIVLQIAERLGGAAWAQCEPGEGCTFFFTLPREAGASHA